MAAAISQEDLMYLEFVAINEEDVCMAVEEVKSKVVTLSPEVEIQMLVQAVRLLDLTSLGNTDTKETIDTLCKQALHPLPLGLENKIQNRLGSETLDHVVTAAVCVYPSKVLDAVSALKVQSKYKIPIAAVAGGFPSGQFPLETRVREVAIAVELGAQEIDIVIDRSLVLTGEWQKLYEEIHGMVVAGKGAHVKVILSTGELGTLENVYKASYVAMLAGAHFIKTSTGKETVNATLRVSVVMCRAIRKYFKKYQRKVGFKPAGGIRTPDDALMYMALVKQELGADYLDPSLFRIGASTLLQEIKSRLCHLVY